MLLGGALPIAKEPGMSTTYHISFALEVAKTTTTLHPRTPDAYSARVTGWAERNNVSAASAASTALNRGLIDDGMTAEVHSVHPESLGIVSAVLHGIETAIAVTCAALARPRPANGDALRVWQDQQKSADKARQEVSATVETLHSWQQVRVDDLIQAIATEIAERPVGSEARGELNIQSLTNDRCEIHPRVVGLRAKRLDEWATLHDVSPTRAASAFLFHGLQHGDSAGITFHVASAEALSVALGEIQTLATALRTNVPALARARPRGGDARRLWADQTEAANAALTRVVPAVHGLTKILRIPKGGSVGFLAKRVALRSEPSAPQGGAS